MWSQGCSGSSETQVTGHPLLEWSSFSFKGPGYPGHCEFWRLHGEHTGPLQVPPSASVQSWCSFLGQWELWRGRLSVHPLGFLRGAGCCECAGPGAVQTQWLELVSLRLQALFFKEGKSHPAQRGGRMEIGWKMNQTLGVGLHRAWEPTPTPPQ